MTRVRLLPEAEDDLSEAAEFLERRVDELGFDLIAEVEHAIARLEETRTWARTSSAACASCA